MKTSAPRAATGKAAIQAAGPAIADRRPAAAKQRNMQAAIASSPRQQARQLKANSTGLPDNLKAGVETLSGYALDDVQVHYNSAQPAQLQAHAYAQGRDIHVAPGQEEHLPHEAWHVVQQQQGRVKPTAQLAGQLPINDNAGLEHEADAQGARATLLASVLADERHGGRSAAMPAGGRGVVQPKLNTSGKKTAGKAGSIKKEVTKTIGRNKLGEMQEDIKVLETSIEFRTAEQDSFTGDQDSEAYKDHAGRIVLETNQLGRLQAAYNATKAAADAARDAAAAARAAKPKTPEEAKMEEGGFTVVKGRKGR